MDHGERGDVGVPFEQRGNAARQFVSHAIQLPHRINHRAVVRVDVVRPAVGMSREVHLHDSFVRQALQKLHGIKIVIEGRDIDVIHVEQQPATGLVGEACDELPLTHRGVSKRDVTARVLQDERPFEEVLHDADSLDDVLQSRLVVRQRQQVVRVDSRDTRPANVV